MNSNQFSDESLIEATEFSLIKKINKNLLFLLLFYGWRIFHSNSKIVSLSKHRTIWNIFFVKTFCRNILFFKLRYGRYFYKKLGKNIPYFTLSRAITITYKMYIRIWLLSYWMQLQWYDRNQLSWPSIKKWVRVQ